MSQSAVVIQYPITNHGMVGNSQPMLRVYSEIERVGPTKASVLIRGQSGTGKELVARAIYSLFAKNSSSPYVVLNSAAIPSELFESELFGHKKGSFTGAIQDKRGKFVEASGGILFLDEIGDMDLGLQAKILRALEDGTITAVGDSREIKTRVRVIAATNKNLEEAVDQGRFREDLYYRINVVPINVPSLSERREDIPLLVDHFCREFCREYERAIKIAPDAYAYLQSLPWRGNIRELRNLIERAVVMNESGEINEDYLKSLPWPFNKEEAARVDHLTAVVQEVTEIILRGEADLPESIRNIETKILEEVLKRTGDDKTNAASILGISRETLYKRLRGERSMMH